MSQAMLEDSSEYKCIVHRIDQIALKSSA